MGTTAVYQAKMPWIFNVIPIIKIYYGFWGIYPFLTNIEEFNWNFVKGAFLTYLFFTGLFTLLNNLYSTIHLTSKKFVINTGIITNYTFDIDIDRIEGTYIVQSFLGGLFNYGKIYVNTAGDSLSYTVANPFELKKQLELIKEK